VGRKEYPQKVRGGIIISYITAGKTRLVWVGEEGLPKKERDKGRLCHPPVEGKLSKGECYEMKESKSNLLFKIRFTRGGRVCFDGKESPARSGRGRRSTKLIFKRGAGVAPKMRGTILTGDALRGKTWE